MGITNWESGEAQGTEVQLGRGTAPEKKKKNLIEHLNTRSQARIF